MTRTVLFIMEDPQTVDITASSSYFLAMEALRRGWRVFQATPDNVFYNSADAQQGMAPSSCVCARGQWITKQGNTWQTSSPAQPETIKVESCDAVMMRQDPPFDMGYITVTYLLDLVHPNTLVVNNPTAVRDCNDKFLMTRFPHIMPPTLISNQLDEIDSFRKQQGAVIIKPLYSFAGQGIFYLAPEDPNLAPLVEMLVTMKGQPFMVQRYLPAIKQGDKRVVLVDGKICGAYLRMPATGQTRANIHTGGAAHRTEITPRDIEICGCIGPVLRQKGLLMAGADIIGDFLIEVNVTSPGGIANIQRFEGRDLSVDIWDSIESKLT